MKNKLLAMLILSMLLISSMAIAFPSSVHATPGDSGIVTINYGNVVLTGGYKAGHFDEIWNLTAGDMLINFTYDARGLVDDAGCHAWAELGIRAVGYGDFNPTWGVEGAGVWLATDYDWTVNTFDPDPPGSPTLDMDDKLLLQKAGGHGEGDYNLPDVPPAPGNNHRFWWDRDGVDPWQKNETANTGGIYHIEIYLHAIDETTGTAYMKINGLWQGFETDGNWNTIELTPAGMTFTGDMEHMQVFYGLYGYGASHTVIFKEITVTGVTKLPYFETEPSHIYGGYIGSEFKVNITLNGLDVSRKVIGAQFRICYNSTLMKPVDVIKGPYMDLGYGVYLAWIAQNHPLFGPSVLVGVLGLPDENGTWHQYAQGSGLLASVVFKVIYRPVEPATAIGTFTLNETMIIDEDLEEIIHNAVADTVYEAMQLKKPTIKVEPEVTNMGLLNKEFSVNVTINDLDIDWRTIAVQFRLCYDATLLEFVDITEGPFMKQAGTTLFMWFNEDNVIYGPSVIVGIFVYPDENGTWHNFPKGSGLLATIKFKAIYQERGLEKPPLTCDLTLCETLIINDEIQETPHNIEDGVFYMYPTNIGDINYDGKVDVKDVAKVAAAFGETPGRPRWDPICDIDGNGKIDTKDVAIVARNYGWRSIYDP